MSFAGSILYVGNDLSQTDGKRVSFRPIHAYRCEECGISFDRDEPNVDEKLHDHAISHLFDRGVGHA